MTRPKSQNFIWANFFATSVNGAAALALLKQMWKNGYRRKISSKTFFPYFLRYLNILRTSRPLNKNWERNIKYLTQRNPILSNETLKGTMISYQLRLSCDMRLLQKLLPVCCLLQHFYPKFSIRLHWRGLFSLQTKYRNHQWQ